MWKIFVELAVDVNKEARFVWERANLSVGKDMTVSRLELKRSGALTHDRLKFGPDFSEY